MKNKDITTQEFEYYLPDEKIAQYPLPQRNHSKLLIYKNGEIYHTQFYNIVDEIPSGYLLIFNDTKVIPARLFFQKKTGAIIEIFLLEPYFPKDYSQIFNQTSTCQWLCMVGNAKRWKANETLALTLIINDISYILIAEKLENNNGTYIIRFSWNAPVSFKEILYFVGKIPIPPYLKRNSEKIDNERYQTIFSKVEGSVASPTASLHFTEQEFEGFKKKHIQTAFLTLHVGIGTFKPMTTKFVHEHELHAETFVFSIELLQKIIQHFPNIIAVGTTSLRALESIYQLAKIFTEKKELVSFIPQWCDNNNHENKTLFILKELKDYMLKNEITNLEIKTQLMISPKYKIRMVNGLITNFHQPKSSLLALVAGFIGNDWKKVYDYALSNNFRFLSYGDSSLLWK